MDAMRATLAEGEFGPDADELWELDKVLGSRKCAISCIGSSGNDTIIYCAKRKAREWLSSQRSTTTTTKQNNNNQFYDLAQG